MWPDTTEAVVCTRLTSTRHSQATQNFSLGSERCTARYSLSSSSRPLRSQLSEGYLMRLDTVTQLWPHFLSSRLLVSANSLIARRLEGTSEVLRLDCPRLPKLHKASAPFFYRGDPHASFS